MEELPLQLVLRGVAMLPAPFSSKRTQAVVQAFCAGSIQGVNPHSLVSLHFATLSLKG